MIAQVTSKFSFRARLISACVGLAICSQATPSAAATAEERAACTPDVFRLCSAEIPNVERIVGCMQKQRAKLSPACAAVFHPAAARTAEK
jgi:hypothetical protein